MVYMLSQILYYKTVDVGNVDFTKLKLPNTL